MSGPLIVLGDKTSHGGAVIEASPTSDAGGKGIARVGDKTACGATLIAGQQATIDNI
ncbi:MAG TPA: hypothetical protein DDX04_17215 [Massilia sp.]|nr:hypothetical protein [Massilia sp.]